MKTTPTNQERARHHAALETLRASGCTTPGLTLWRRLRRIEAEARRATTAQCNGEAYEGQPYRDEEQWESYFVTVAVRVRDAFGGRLPRGFFLNGDARGCALKIAPGSVPDGMATDWGGNGMLAAEID